MRLPLLLFLFFEVSNCNPTIQLPEGLITSDSFQNGRLELNQNVLQQIIKSVIPSSENVRPYSGEEFSKAEACENARNQYNHLQSDKYQHVTQYPKKFYLQGEEYAVKQRAQNEQPNINSQHIYKRMTDENALASQNYYQQPQNLPPSQILYQQQGYQNSQAMYQPTAPNVDEPQENPYKFREQNEQETIKQQQILQQQLQMKQNLLLAQKRQQLHIQQQQFRQLQKQQQKLQLQRQQQLEEQQLQQQKQLEQQQQLQLQRQQQLQEQQLQQQKQLEQQQLQLYQQKQLMQTQQQLQQKPQTQLLHQQQSEQSQIHQQPAYLPPNFNYQQHYSKDFHLGQEYQQGLQVQGSEGPQNAQENYREEPPRRTFRTIQTDAIRMVPYSN